MKKYLIIVQMVFGKIGKRIGLLVGGCDGLIYALLVFVVMNYITAVMCAVIARKMSREVIFGGICRKLLIFFLVVAANILDVEVIGNGSVLRTAVILFYISNEGISLLGSAGYLGLPIPVKMLEVLERLYNKSGDRSEMKDADKV